jgi:hypothetical protein
VQGTAVDSSNNVYYIISGTNPDTGNPAFFVQKRNSSGVIQWQRRLTGIQTSGILRSIAVDTSNNVYISADSQSEFQERSVVVKLDSSGNITWQRQLNPSESTSIFGSSVAINSSGDVYVGGLTSVTGAGQEFLLYKLDSSGATLWQRRFGGSGTQSGRSIALDSNGDVYIYGTAFQFASEMVLAKYNSSGTLQWQRKFTSPSGFIQTPSAGSPRALTIDSNNNIYLTGFFRVSSSPNLENAFIVKYNSSGVIQWQRRLGPPAILGDRETTSFGYAVTTDSAGAVYFVGTTNVFVDRFSNGFFFAKLPPDGSKTGTYTVGGFSFTYAASSFTESAGTFDSNTISYSSSNNSWGIDTTALADTASSLVSSVTTI